MSDMLWTSCFGTSLCYHMCESPVALWTVAAWILFVVHVCLTSLWRVVLWLFWRRCFSNYEYSKDEISRRPGGQAHSLRSKIARKAKTLGEQSRRGKEQGYSSAEWRPMVYACLSFPIVTKRHILQWCVSAVDFGMFANRTLTDSVCFSLPTIQYTLCSLLKSMWPCSSSKLGFQDKSYIDSLSHDSLSELSQLHASLCLLNCFLAGVVSCEVSENQIVCCP